MKTFSSTFFKDLTELHRVSFKNGVCITTESLNKDAALFDTRLQHDALYIWAGPLHLVFDLRSTAVQAA